MRQKPSLFSILLWVALAALCVGIVVMAPGTVDAYVTLAREQQASPTPTAFTGSVLAVTLNPGDTPTPTQLVLKPGVKSDEVTKLQTKLKELGYLSGEVDGQYGPGTAEAVKLFQEQTGLAPDGVAGNATLTTLYGGNAPTYIPTPTPSATPSRLQKGDQGTAVSSLQQRLKDLGYLSGAVDGDYGGATQEAVRFFQRQNGLEVDGVCGPGTMAAVFATDAPHAQATPTPDPSQLPLLVNRDHPVSEDYTPGKLVLLRNVLPASLVYVKGSEIQGDAEAVDALKTMFEAAKADGVTGFQVSAGYRSFQYQQELFDKQVNAYLQDGRTKASAVSATRQTVADPGTSEHHTGLAFDITVAGTIFKGTKQQIWLHKHCWDYGFIVRYQEGKEDITGFIAEDWHIRYVGVTHATAMRDQALTLEEYIQQLSK